MILTHRYGGASLLIRLRGFGATVWGDQGSKGLQAGCQHDEISGATL